MRSISLLSILASSVLAAAPSGVSTPSDAAAPLDDPFRQMDELWPTPTDTRAASGAPGHRYWQQQVDYDIDVTLDDERQRISGSERITYRNNSPDTLEYLWLQLDANIFAPDSRAALTSTSGSFDRISYRGLERMLARQSFDGSVALTRVEARGKPLDYVVVDTMMRVDLPKPLAPGKTFKFDVDWSYAINESERVGGRTGFERFDDGNVIYEIAQWFPRLARLRRRQRLAAQAVLGLAGEFALEFGDYEVDITVPADHVVGATGELHQRAQGPHQDPARALEAGRGPGRPGRRPTPGPCSS